MGMSDDLERRGFTTVNGGGEGGCEIEKTGSLENYSKPKIISIAPLA